ncbi:unnamed protein product [Hyaloperonospora brassicae]|uniref:Uncharacterized protein n=1 Tax=Hyaloperonospora brassicae TaxID=162125 RepID=A0AAV0UW69_HYABA|nr:unnamed protein product [Hyaloperonospora brassicae]
MTPKTTPIQEKHALERHYGIQISQPIVETIVGDMFFRNDEMLDNDKDDDEDDFVASDATKAVGKEIAKKSSEKAPVMKLIDSTDGPINGYFVDGGTRIDYADIVALIEDQASRVMQRLAALSDDEKLDAVSEVATYAMTLMLGLQSVRAERDVNNLPLAHDALPIIDVELNHRLIRISYDEDEEMRALIDKHNRMAHK